MRIAILAWGSLVWDPRTLAIDGDFLPTGPRLPIEFSRISRNRRLTLVIDESSGVPCATYVAQSARSDLAGAVEDLRVREGMPGTKGIEALRQNPAFGGAYHCLASAFAHLGRDAEAREAAARVLEVDPAFTISARMGRRRQSHAKLLIEGLRKAGLPE